MSVEIVRKIEFNYNTKDKCKIVEFKHPVLSGQLIVQPAPPAQSIEQEFSEIAKQLSDDKTIFAFYPSCVFKGGEYCMMRYNRDKDVLVNMGKFECEENLAVLEKARLH
jgi:hypothetical protein